MKSFIPAVFSAILILASCQKEGGSQSLSSGEGPITVSISAEMGEFAPTAKSTAESCIRMKWESTDKVYAYGSNGTAVVLLSAEAGLEVALIEDDPYRVTISGTLSAAPDGGVLYLLHSPVLSIAPSISSGKVSIDMKNQNEANVIPFVAYATVTGVTGTSAPSTAKFNFATSVIKANVVDLGSGIELSNVTINDCNTVCELNFSDGDVTVGSAVKSKTASENIITRILSGNASATGRASFYIAVPKQVAGVETKTITVVSGSEKYSFNSPALGTAAIAANQYVNTILASATFISEFPLNGLFTIDSKGTKVRFSKGNLQYQSSTQTWRFAANQYDFIGNAVGNNVSTRRDIQSDWIDLFGWGVTGYQDARTCSTGYQINYMPYSIGKTEVGSTDPAYYINRCGYGPDYDSTNKYGLSVGDKSDWGYCMGGTSSLWRTLTSDEWSYLFSGRTDASLKSGYATVADKTGMIILPDSFTDPKTNTSSKATDGAFNPKTTGWTANVYTVGENWSAMESAGAVFLPASGLRDGSQVSNVGERAFYWSSTAHDGYQAHDLYFKNDKIAPADYHERFRGQSVRLVTEAK